MEIEDVQKDVIAVIADSLGIEEDAIWPDSEFKEELGVNSLSLVHMVMNLEEKFRIKISDEASEKFCRVGQVIDNIVAALRQEGRLST